LSLLLLSAAACHGIAVDATHAPDVDFTTLRTFSWLEAAPGSPTDAREDIALELVASELTAKGLKRDDASPDLLVAVHRSIEGGMHTKRSGYEFRDGRLQRYELQEGTLVVDLITASDREAVWRGTANGAFKFEMMPEEREQLLASVLHDMFEDFPPGR
jgi:hypothetical protein